MLKTCFSSRKGYHLGEDHEEYEINRFGVENTIGFDQLKWSNDFNYLILEDGLASEENVAAANEKEESTEIARASVKKQKLNKIERKELRKLKRQQRKLPSLSLHSHSELTQKELVALIEQAPESFELHNTSLYKQDLYTLKSQEWLNDNIITYVYNILENYQLKPFYREYNLSENTILLLPPSLCYLVLTCPDPQTLVSMFPENFNKCKFLILPLNDGGSHWSLSVISLLDRCYLSFDSLTNLNIEENELISRNFETIIRNLLGNDKFTLIKKTLNTPQQQNDYDCGVFVICLSCFLVSELIGSRVEGNSWRLDFNLDAKIRSVDCTAIRTFILKSVIDGTVSKAKSSL